MNPARARGLISWVLSQIRVGSLTLVEGDRRRLYGAGAPTATMEVYSPEVWPLLLSGSRGLPMPTPGASGTALTWRR